MAISNYLRFREDAEKVQYAKAESSTSGLKRTGSTTSSSQTPEGTPSKQAAVADTATPTPASKTTNSHLAKLTPKQGIVIKEKQATDFFGRVIKVGFLFGLYSSVFP